MPHYPHLSLQALKAPIYPLFSSQAPIYPPLGPNPSPPPPPPKKVKNYKILAKGSKFEIRIYPPCKRTIKIVGRFYFLPFPYMVYGKFTGVNVGRYADFNVDIGNWLYVGLSSKDLTSNSLGQFVYYPPLGNISGWQACLNSGRINNKENGHYMQPIEDTFEDLLYKFWNYEFSGEVECEIFGGRFHSWARMKPEEVLEAVPRIDEKITLSNFIGITAKGEGTTF